VAAPLTALAAGHVFPEVTLTIDAAAARAYRDAVGDEQPVYAAAGAAVPPLAVVALALGALLRQAELPPGSLHASESVEAHRVVHEGDAVRCRTVLAQRSLRAGFVVSVLESELSVAGEAALTARATVLSPQQQS
jgi:acyl dehydratase